MIDLIFHLLQKLCYNFYIIKVIYNFKMQKLSIKAFYQN